jgi:hypothetical protein
MTTHAEIKKAILKAAGNPVSGAIVEMADEFARVVLALFKPATTQTRVEEPEEKR